MFNRLKQLWKLSNKDPKALEKLLAISREEVELIPEQGDGKAVLLTEGTQEDYDEFNKERTGWDKFYEKLKNL